jgi:hypothetical protein
MSDIPTYSYVYGIQLARDDLALMITF